MYDYFEAIIKRIQSTPMGVELNEVYDNLVKDYPDLTENMFYLCWKAAELL
jgi:hypothetical protein